MFPLKTLPNARRAPHLTRLIILINVLVFMGQWFERTFMSVDSAVYYGVVPRCSLFPGQCGLGYISGEKHFWLTLFTSLFLHADILHIGFNMLFLSVFGGGLEDKFGRLRFLLVYFGGGIIAGLTHVAFHPFSLAPTIGASGAIAAVMGAYLIALPKSWVLTYIPPFFFLPVPAPLFLVVWIGAQVFGAFHSISFGSASSADGIAWMAHLGGFIAGGLYGWRLAPWVKKGQFA